MKKEAAADGPVEPPARVPGAGVSRAAVQAPPRPQVADAPSGPTAGAPSRTVSATATAATAASAWRKRGEPVSGRHTGELGAGTLLRPHTRGAPPAPGTR